MLSIVIEGGKGTLVAAKNALKDHKDRIAMVIVANSGRASNMMSFTFVR